MHGFKMDKESISEWFLSHYSITQIIKFAFPYNFDFISINYSLIFLGSFLGLGLLFGLLIRSSNFNLTFEIIGR